MYLNSLFGTSTIEACMHSALCSGQDEHVINITIMELKKQNPRIRFVLTTSIAGMGFDPENVTQVIHAFPPRNLSQYLQEIGRAGPQGESAKAILYYGNRDIAKHVPGINENIINYCRNEDSCLKNVLLSTFGFEKDTSIAGCFLLLNMQIYLFM
jgi:ATP-dependent DNA helicase RecQ